VRKREPPDGNDVEPRMFLALGNGFQHDALLKVVEPAGLRIRSLLDGGQEQRVQFGMARLDRSRYGRVIGIPRLVASPQPEDYTTRGDYQHGRGNDDVEMDRAADDEEKQA